MAVPVNHGCSSEKKQTKKRNPIPSLLAVVTACFELEIFKVNASATTGHLAKSIKAAPRGRGWDRRQLALWRTVRLIPRSNCSTTYPEVQLLYCRNFKPLHKLWKVIYLKTNHQFPVDKLVRNTFPRS